MKKKLQQNFTTIAQSNRLLELGVPANSADCYYDSWKQIQWRQLADLHNDFFDVYKHYTPCWSVGRLIEIFEICTPYVFTGFYNYTGTNTEVMIKIYESVIYHPVENLIDFSELED